LFKDQEKERVTAVAGEVAQNKALKGYGNNLFSDFLITNIDKNKLNPDRIFDIDGDGVSALEIIFIPTENFKNFAKGNLGTVSSTLQFTVTYKGRTNNTVSGDYAKGAEVYRTSINADFDMSKIKNGRNAVTYSITNPTPDPGKVLDRASNAQYEIDIKILYHLSGASGGDVDANQIAKANKTVTFTEAWYISKDIQTAILNDDLIAKERNNA